MKIHHLTSPSWHLFPRLLLSTQLFIAAALLPSVSAACGSYESLADYGVIGEGSFSAGNNSTINDNAITGSGNTPTPDGTMETVDENFPGLDPASFPATGGSNTSAGTIAAGSYGKINASGTTVFTGGDYYITTLNLTGNNSTIRLAPGNYFINTLSMDNKTNITISPSGTVRLYVGSSLQAGNQVHMNSGGNVADFNVFLYNGSQFQVGNANQGDTQLDFNGIIYSPYSNTTIQFGNNNEIQGAILSAGKVQVGNNTDFTYDAAIQTVISESGSCRTTVALDSISASVTEGDTGNTTNVVLGISLSEAADTDVSVEYATTDVTATAGSDYGAISGTLTFVAGETTASVSIPVYGDNDNESDETLSLTLANADGTNLGSHEATITIIDDDLFPLADYHFDEIAWDGTSGEVIDSSGNGYHGTANANTPTLDATTAGGGLCRVVDLSANGTSDYIKLPEGALDGLNSLSVAAWIKASNTNGQQEILQGLGSSTGDDEIEIYLDGNDLRVYFRDINEKFDLYGSDLVDDSWHHFAITRSGNNVCLYLDGALKECKTFGSGSSGTLSIHTGALISGQEQDSYGGGFDSNQDFQGYLDELLVFDSALSANQIQAGYANQAAGKNWDGSARECPTEPSPTLVADWRMDEASWNGTSGEAADSSGNGLDGTAAGGAVTISGGQVCRAGSFDGSNDYLQVAGLSNHLNGTASLAFWIKTTQTGNDTMWFAPGITGVEQPAGGTDDIFWGWIDASGHIGIGGGYENNQKSATSINDGNWHHVVLTRYAPNGAYKIYIDGDLDASGTTVSGTIGNDYSSLGRIENTNISSTPIYFSGQLDEVLIFDSVLSTSDVLAGYTNQAAGKNWDGTARDCPVVPSPSGCAAIFPSALQNSSASGKIEFGWDAQVSDPDNALETQNSIIFNSWGAQTCGSVDCTATGTSSAEPTLETFATSSSTHDVTLGWRQDYTLGSGGSGEYRNISGGGRSTISDGGSYSVYKIKTLTLNWRDTLELRSGTDYWIENLVFNSSENNITVSGSGTARLFIGNATTFSWDADVNEGGDPERLLIVGYDDLTFSNGNPGRLNALVYAVGDITTSSDLDPSGALAAGGKITLGSSATVTYDADAVEALDDRGFCSEVAAELHHLELLHDGSALTCEAEGITVKACADADCTTTYDDSVTVDFTFPSSGWSSDPLTFSGGSTTVELSHTTVETVTLAATVTSPTATSATECVNSGSGAPCAMTFAEVGILIDGDDDDQGSDTESDILTQIAAKPSNSGYNAKGQRVRVVRTDTQTGACVAAVANETLDTTFSYLVPIANDGLNDNTFTISNGTTSTTLGSAGNGQTVALTFDGNGTAPFSFTSQDAGRYQLQVAMQLPVIDGNGDPTGDTISASDTSNGFVVRPLALFADGSGNPKAQTAGGTVYKKAGESFTINFKSLRWASGRDDDANGLWDTCGGSDLSDPSSGYARVPAWTIGKPTADLALPTGGNNPALSYSADVAFTAKASTAGGTAAFTEVGIIQLQQGGSNSFLGETVKVCSPYIGRFIPDHFAITPDTVTEGCDSGNFTYYGYDGFATAFTITAQAPGPGNATTQNYTGAFAKLALNSWSDTGSATGYRFSATGLPAGSTLAASTTNPTGSWNNGVASVTATHTVARSASALPPADATVSSLPVDPDGVTMTSAVAVHSGTTPLRYGRAYARGVHGPGNDGDTVFMEIGTQYFDGTGWSANGADGCTTYTFTDTQTDVTATIAPSGTVPLTAGRGDLAITTTAGGADGGTVAIDFNFADSWLHFDWDEDGTIEGGTGTDDKLEATATFGIFRGDDRFLYWSEQ